jgi:hypothetical protein
MADENEYAYMQWEAKNRLSIEYRYEKAHPGTYAITATIPLMPTPMGIVWIRFPGNTAIETLNSFVDSRVRRCGIRTAIHKWMLAQWPEVTRIITTSGTDYGLPWLKATGFKLNPRTKDWEYTRKKDE